MVSQSPTRSHPSAAAPPTGAARRQPPTVAVVLGLAVVLAAVVGVLFVALGLPAAKSAPHDVPLGIAGSASSAQVVQQHLEQRGPDVFAVTTYADESALRSAIGDRDVYGGIVAGADGFTVLTASGGSPAVAQSIAALAGPLAQAGGQQVPVEDVAPLPDSDPRGAGLAAAGLPLTMAGILPAVLIGLRLGHRPVLAAVTALLAASAIGSTVALLLHSPFGAVRDDLVPVAAALALGSATISLTLLGLRSVLGTAGLGLGAAVFVLLGTPLSGLASAPELLPAGWGTFGQYLPPGAAATMLRSTAYFDGAGAGRALAVLAGYVVAGLALLALGQRLHRSSDHAATAA